MESLHLKHSGSTENYPQIEFINTGNGAHAGSIIFKKNGGAAADDDKLGRILLQGQDENSNTEDFARNYF